MNLKKALQVLSSHPSLRKYYLDGWMILKVGEEIAPQLFRYYAIDRQHQLGQGSYGRVYKAYKMDEEGNIDATNPMVAKEFKNPKSDGKLADTELKALRRFSDSEGALYPINDKIYLFSTFLPGKNLENSLHEIAHLDLFERINLICQLLLQLNHLHHHTNYGSPLLHGDLKTTNVMFSAGKQEPNGRIIPNQCTLIDFGLSMLNIDDASQLKPHPHIPPNIEINTMYFSPETLDGQFGLKVDIFMLVNVIAQLLGQPDPSQNKANALQDQESTFLEKKVRKKIAAMPFSISNLVDFPEIHGDNSLKALTIQFINHMQHPNYHDRPDSDAALQFFSTLRNLYKSPADIKDESFSTAKTKLLIYANGLWPRPEKELATLLRKMNSKNLKTITQAVTHDPQQYSHLKLQLFILNYKKACRFSFFGNVGRSQFGKKVFRGELQDLNEVNAYVRTFQARTAAHVFQKLESTSSRIR